MTGSTEKIQTNNNVFKADKIKPESPKTQISDSESREASFKAMGEMADKFMVFFINSTYLKNAPDKLLEHEVKGTGFGDSITLTARHYNLAFDHPLFMLGGSAFLLSTIIIKKIPKKDNDDGNTNDNSGEDSRDSQKASKPSSSVIPDDLCQ